MIGGYIILFSSLVAAFLRYAFRNIVTPFIMGEPAITDKQTIEFSGSEGNPTSEVHAREVEVVSAGSNHYNDVNRIIQSISIVDYCWEERFYTGQLLAVHREGMYVAYGIKGKPTSQCAIRVVNLKTSKRALMKDAEGMIEDLAFAHTPNTILLACVDNLGVLLVYKITEDTKEIKCNLILHVLSSKEETAVKGIPFRVFWCPYIPNEETVPGEEYEDDVSELLALTRHVNIELWNVATVSSKVKDKTITADEVKEGHLVIEAHTDLITEAVFSPDGTAIATASMDGTCKFYQVYMVTGEDESRCLHEWIPHGGKPVTSLFFLDDHQKYNPDIQFWKFAVTGTSNNSELKIWSCESWHCLQTLRFSNAGCESVKFKVGLDLSAGFIVISDMANKILYVLELYKGDDEPPYVASVTELRLSYAILSFGIVEAYHERYRPEPAFLDSDSSTGDKDDEVEMAVAVRMYIVQPKSLQSCNIVYPTPAKRVNLNNKLDFPAIESNDTHSNEVESGVKLENCSDNIIDLDTIPLPPSSSIISLMTPEAFSKHSKPPTPSCCVQNHQVMEGSPVRASEPPPLVDILNPPTEDASPPFMDASRQQSLVGLTSGGSSPSREVQQILSIHNSPYFQSDNANDWSSGPPPLPPQQTELIPPPEGLPVPYFEAEMNSLKNDLATLVILLKQQSHEIQELRNEIKTRDEELSEKLEAGMRQIWKEQEPKLVESARWDQEQAISHISQLVDNSISNKLSHLIETHMTNASTAVLKDVKEIIHNNLTKQMAATEILLKENINKMVRSKGMTEVLSNSLTQAIKPSLVQICKDTFAESLPKFEKVCSAMYKQMSDAFSNGTAEYVVQVENQLKRHTERSQSDLKVLQESAQAFSHANQNIAQSLDNFYTRLEEQLVENVSKAVLAKVKSASASLARSRAVTPGVNFGNKTLQTLIMDLVSQGQISTAFQQALSASNLEVVMFLCEKVPVSSVFTPSGCLLQQHVLLSLIQQLSADMSSHSDIRHKYLEEAVLHLNACDPVTKEHMPAVLSSLSKQLKHFISTNPNSPLLKNIKMLQLATQSLI